MVLSILLPFIIGGVIAFILNIPMKGIEDKVLKKWRGKAAAKAKRPISMVLSIILVFAIVALGGNTDIPFASDDLAVFQSDASSTILKTDEPTGDTKITCVMISDLQTEIAEDNDENEY